MNLLPEELNKYIDKSVLNGYLRFLDETMRTEYTKLLENYYQWEGGIPFAITAFADILVWNDKYVYKYNLLDNDVSVILSGFDYFFQNIEDEDYQKDYFELDLYEMCREKIGDLNFDECYTFEPIPALGGSKTTETVSKGKSPEFVALLIQFS